MNEKFQKQQGESQVDFFFFCRGWLGGGGWEGMGGLNNYPKISRDWRLVCNTAMHL